MKLIPILMASVLATGAFASDKQAHSHNDKPLHGGQVVEVNDMDFELVSTADSIALYVRDHGKPVILQGATAKLTMLSGSEKTEFALTAGADGKLQGAHSRKLASGTKVVAVVTVAGRKPTTVRFVAK